MEIGIALLPDQDFQSHAQHQISFHQTPYPNIPHISLFQMDVECDHVQECMKRLDRCSFRKLNFKINFVQHRCENYALNLKEMTHPPQFQVHMQAVIDAFATLRSRCLLQQINPNDLSDLERKRVEQYGIYWNLPPQHSQPYMTLLYNFKQPVDILKLNQCFQGKDFSCATLAIVEIGFHGNVINILKMVHLQ